MDNYEKRKEFSWHLICPDCIETERIPQFLPNCWANAMATCIGDNFCIAENLKAIYPSSIWITSLQNDFNKFKGVPLDTMLTGFIITPERLKYFLKNYYISLESCHSTKTTYAIVRNSYEKIFAKDVIKPTYNFRTIASQTILEKELFFPCCSNCLYKNKTSNLISCLDKCEDEDEDLYKFKIFLDDSNFFHYREIYDSNIISETLIKGVQMVMKTMLCSGPIMSPLVGNNNYLNYAKKILENIKTHKDSKIPIFYQFEPTVSTYNHIIEILGWGVESAWGSNEEFWYIKDSNFPSLFLKIPFTTKTNLKFSIGPDLIPGIDDVDSASLSWFFSIKTKALDTNSKRTLIENGLIKLSDNKTLDELNKG